MSNPPLTLPAVRYGAPSVRVRKLDRHTRATLWMFKGAIRAWKGSRPTIANIRPPRLWGRLPMKRLPIGREDFAIELPTLDEDWPAAPVFRKVFLAFLRNRTVFPVRDRDETWVCREEARDTYQEVLPLGSFMARPYHHWPEMSSDAAMSRLGFAGLGALRMLPYRGSGAEHPALASAAWCSDLSYLRKYDVRPGFERYGARAFFDVDQRLVAIDWCHGHKLVRPGDAEWEHAKWVWRCSLLVGSTLTDHLIGVHWLIANYVTTAVRTSMSPTHYLRLLLKPFTWRTITINAGASETLCPEGGLVHRASALTYPALLEAFSDSVDVLRFFTARELIARKGAAGMGDRFPWATDALALYEVIHAFVDDYLSLYADEAAMRDDVELSAFWHHLHSAPPTVRFPGHTRQALVDVVSQFIWCVTGLHETVGAVHELVLDPTFAGTKIRPGRDEADVQASMQALLVMALTGLDMPKLIEIGDAEAIFGGDFRGRGAFARFHEALVALSAQIQAANERRSSDPERPWPCWTFDPRVLETGVSI